MRTICCILIASLPAACALAAEQVSTIDARQFDAAGVVVTADKVEFTSAGKKESLARTDVAEIVLGKTLDVMTKPGQCVLVTLDGAQLAAGNVNLSGSKIKCDNVLLGATELPLEALKVVYQPDAKGTARQVEQRCQELKVSTGQEDVLVVAKTETDWVTVEGVLKSIDADNVTFTWEESDRTVARKTIRALWAAMLGKKEPKPAAGFVVGVDGSVSAFTSLTMDDKTITVELPAFGKKTLARPDVAAIRFNSSRVVNLSDLKPSAVKEYGTTDSKFPYRLNQSVAGKEMKLDSQAYSTGIGVHSYSELSYTLDGAYTTFVTVTGIDDSVRPGGDAAVTFLGDGKELDKPMRLTGKDKPSTVRLKVAGVKQLTIRVDFGPDGIDVSDHVDFAAARLIK